VRRSVPEPDIWKNRVRVQKNNWLARLREKEILRNGLLATSMNACGMFGYWGLFTWIPGYLSLPAAQGGRGLSLAKTTSFFLVLCFGKWLGYSSFGFFADAFGRRKPYFTYLLVAAALVPIYGMSRSSFWLLLLGPFVAFFGTGFFSGYAAIASEIFPGEIRAAAMGLSYNVGRGFSAIAPFAVGALALKYGIGPAFFLQAGAFFVAAMLALLLPETRGRQLT
jgi:MFS family permease